MKASYYKNLLLVLMCMGITGVHGEEHEWTNIQGKTIKAGFVSATNEAVTISMTGKTFVVKLADLSPQSRALAAKLRVQKSTAQKPGANVLVETPQVVVDATKAVDYDQLERRDGLMYFEGKPFTGVAVEKWPNGQKRLEVTFKDGKEHDLTTLWYDNGQKNMEGTAKDGVPVAVTVWKPNGEKCPDTNFVNGNGIICYYHDNGQKKEETTFRDGKRDGLRTKWHENGQKKEESVYQNRKRISSKYWDKDGKPE